MQSSLQNLRFFRLRMWSKGGYAASFADRTRQHYTLIEGFGRKYAHIVEIQGKHWVEITQSPLVVAGGVGRSVVLWIARPGVVVRKRLREFPNDTRRVDITSRREGVVDHRSFWTFKNGSSASATCVSGEKIVEFKDPQGRVRKTWKTTIERLGADRTFRQTQIFDGAGRQVGTSTATKSGNKVHRETTGPGAANSDTTTYTSRAGEIITTTNNVQGNVVTQTITSG